MTDDEIAGLGAVVLFAGHETTVVRIDFGTLLFAANPEQIALLRCRPELVPRPWRRCCGSRDGGGGVGLPRYRPVTTSRSAA